MPRRPVITTEPSPNNAASEGLSFKAVTYWNNPNAIARDTGNTRRLYAVADRNNFNGVVVDSNTGANNNAVGIVDAVLNVPVEQRNNMIFMLDPDDGSVINRYNGQNRNGLPAQSPRLRRTTISRRIASVEPRGRSTTQPMFPSMFRSPEPMSSVKRWYPPPVR